ncbi:hypothetical protein [Polaribacter aestuariivivens]|uniref:hypothetical protein n=1 Tax=Polaribacter aestuariivivens TaxID=2304626 RepID=UPI003F494FFE
MKTIITTLIILFTILVNSQNKVLKVNFGEGKNQWIMYPPNTKFSLKNKMNTIVFSDKNSFGKFSINEIYTLEIFPPYRNESDIYTLDSGSIELIEKDNFISEEKKYKKKKNHSNAIAAEKIITTSKTNPNRKNLTLKFTNGIEFSYTDGKVRANLDGKDLYVENKYVIYSKLGIAKISFNPKNGETWWVFEANKN